ncbi:uncharacterized protein C19orf47 homolog isoform X2 [Falco naumanni]|uniref:uncharacterized protein C19orf47 homolog isoform X2 n=1 Tax=Falco naumanni TaxID=148594 RepID=UPI001ADE3CF3|nr:uncharacterized protein C19orf47 homolog isoform X2 [Falco naumanni]
MGLQPPCPGVLSPALSAGCSGCCRLTHPASSRSAMVSVTMATSEWIQFFKEAGIPPGPAVNYAVMFVDNRIQKNMLLDLNKEIMNELGITVVGDIIAILKHAKIVYRQEMCKAATELLCPSSPNVQAELRRNASSAASRMITNSLSRDPPPAAPLRQRPHTSKISVTVSNKLAATKAGLGDMADGNPTIPAKRRRVTAEMEGKYIINMPKGTTPRTKKILEQQAAKGLQRTSVFDRLGAEAKADTTTGGKYAGVLKKLTKPPRKESAEPTGGTVKAKATSSEAKLVTTTATQRLSQRNIATAAVKPSSKISVIGITAVPVEAQDGDVSSTKDKNDPEFRVTIKRTWGCGKVSSTSEPPGAQMDSTGTVSVFKRLGKKPD